MNELHAKLNQMPGSTKGEEDAHVPAVIRDVELLLNELEEHLAVLFVRLCVNVVQTDLHVTKPIHVSEARGSKNGRRTMPRRKHGSKDPFHAMYSLCV